MHHETSGAALFSRRTQGQTVMTVCGELDMATTAVLRDQLVTLLRDTAAPVIIDLSGVSFCDASGLALLVGAQRRVRLHGHVVVLAGPRHNVSKLLRITASTAPSPSIRPSPLLSAASGTPITPPSHKGARAHRVSTAVPGHDALT